MAGAGAALWGPPGTDGVRPCLAQLVVSLPHVDNSMVAEAIGLRVGLGLAAACDCVRDLAVMGDNLPILRMAAACGRLTTADPWRAIEAPVMRAAADQWGVAWSAVRRCFNRTADRLATRGVMASIAAARRRDRRPAAWLWLDPSLVLSRPLLIPWLDYPLAPLPAPAAAVTGAAAP